MVGTSKAFIKTGNSTITLPQETTATQTLSRNEAQFLFPAIGGSSDSLLSTVNFYEKTGLNTSTTYKIYEAGSSNKTFAYNSLQSYCNHDITASLFYNMNAYFSMASKSLVYITPILNIRFGVKTQNNAGYYSFYSTNSSVAPYIRGGFGIGQKTSIDINVWSRDIEHLNLQSGDFGQPAFKWIPLTVNKILVVTDNGTLKVTSFDQIYPIIILGRYTVIEAYTSSAKMACAYAMFQIGGSQVSLK